MATPATPFIDPTLPLISVFSEYGLNERQVEPLIPKLAPAFQRSVISVIAEQIGKPQLVEAKTPIFEIYRQPNDWPAATIATNTPSGSDRILTWSEPTFQAIREGNKIFAKSGAIGYVKAIAAGTITISFLSNPNGNTGFVSTDFVVGELASDGGDVTNPNDRQNKTTLFTLPVNYKNIVSSISDSCTLNAYEAKQYTYIQAVNGKNYYAQSKVTQMLGRMQQNQSLNMIRNIPANFDTNKPIGASLVNQIITMGGKSRPITAPIDESEFNAAIQEYINNGGYNSKRVIIVGGSSYIQDIQKNVFKQFLTTAGQTNVIGGDTVHGLNAWEYPYSGFTFVLVMDEILNNPNMFFESKLFPGETVRSKSAIWINDAPTQTENGGTLPFVQDYYYLASDMITTEIDGMTNMQGMPVSKGTTGKLSASVQANLNKTTQFTNPPGCFYHYAAN